MSVIVIKYSAVDTAISETKSASKRMKQFADEMSETIRDLERLPGTDDEGYVSSALQAARAKRDAAMHQSGRYSNYSEKLKNIVDYAKKQDQTAANTISDTVNAYVGPRSWWDKVKDAAYNAYVDFLDRLEGLGPVGKMLAQFIRSSVTAVGNWKRKMANWFKYGDGKYLLNIFDAFKDVAIAVGMIIAAAALIVASAPAWIIAFATMAVICGSVYLIMQMKDSSIKIEENTKAWNLSGGFKNNKIGEFDSNGNITAARYYGDIEGTADRAKKYDWGDAAANESKEMWGEIFDHEKKLMKTLTKVFTTIAYLGSAGYAHAKDGSYILKGADGKSTFSVKNWVHKNVVDTGMEKGNINPLKGGNIFSKVLGHKNTSKVIKMFSGDKSTGAKVAIGTAVVVDFFKDIGTVQKTVDAYNHFTSGDASLSYDTIDKGFDMGGNLPYFDAWTGDGWTLIDSGKKLITEIFYYAPKEENAYLQYLHSRGGIR